MITLNLYSQHTGDILMALPALCGLLAEGREARILARPCYSASVHAAGVTFVTYSDSREDPDYRGVHRARAWLRHFAVKPVRASLPQGKGNVIVLSPWADFVEKRWPENAWIAVGEALIAAGHRVRLIGPGHAMDHFPALRRLSGLQDQMGLCTPSSWPRYFLDARCVVSPDTAAVHMADAMGVCAVGLYGYTRLDKYGPFWNPHHCVEGDTMHAITPGAVLASIEKAL